MKTPPVWTDRLGWSLDRQIGWGIGQTDRAGHWTDRPGWALDRQTGLGIGSHRGHSITAIITRVLLAVTGVTVSRSSSAEWYRQLQVTISRPTSAGWYWQLQGNSITANISRVVLAVTRVIVSRPTSAGWYWQLQGHSITANISRVLLEVTGAQYQSQHQQCGTGNYRYESLAGAATSIMFVATNVCLSRQPRVCLLSRQKLYLHNFVATKDVSRQN